MHRISRDAAGRSVVASTLMILTCLVLGFLSGGMLVISVSLVSFWKSLAPSDFQAWCAAHAHLVGRLMIPLGVGAIVVTVAAVTACWRGSATTRCWLLIAAGSRTFYLRIIFRDLSQSACVVPISRLSALETRCHPFFQASWLTSEHTCTASFHDHTAAPFRRPPAAGATVTPETAARLAASTHGPSIRPPSPVYTAATPSPSPCHWSPREPANPNQVTTPIGPRSSADQTITVLDPRHPMYGRTFPLVAITHHSQLGRCCVVWLQPHVERFIPVQATNLAFDPNAISPSPLSIAAVEHLLRVFQDIQHAHQGVSRDASPHCPNGTPSHARRPDCSPSAVEPPVSRPATACPTGAHPCGTTVDGSSAEPTPN